MIEALVPCEREKGFYAPVMCVMHGVKEKR